MNRYQNNAFRVLGLPPNASGKDVLARANEIRVKSSVGMAVSFDYDFPWMGPVDRSEENINNAVQRLENPVSRFREEIFWFWISTDVDKEAINLLIKGDKKGANSCWKADNLSAKHNRFILAHSVVVGLESSIVYDSDEKIIRCAACSHEYDAGNYVFCLECGGQLISIPKRGFKKLSETHWKNWNFVMDQVLALDESLGYWAAVRERARNIADARLNDGRVELVRERFIDDLLKVNFSLIKCALAVKDLERVKAHSSLFGKRPLPADVLRSGFNDVLKTRIAQMQDVAVKYAKTLSEGKRTTQKSLYALSNELIAETAEALHECEIIDQSSISDVALAKDHLAKTVRSISIELNNKFDDYEHAVALLNKAIGIAASEYVRKGFEKDQAILQGNLKRDKDLLYQEDVSQGRLIIDKKKLTVGRRSLLIEKITGIRYGIFVQSTNGIPTTRQYTFWLTDGNEDLEIECNNGMFISSDTLKKKFNEIHNRLFQLVQTPLLDLMIENFKAGEDVLVANISIDKKGWRKSFDYNPISKAGLNLVSNIFGGENAEIKEQKERFMSWEDYGGHSYENGNLYIFRKEGNKNRLWISFTLRDVWNAANLGLFLDYLSEEGRLWLILKEK